MKTTQVAEKSTINSSPNPSFFSPGHQEPFFGKQGASGERFFSPKTGESGLSRSPSETRLNEFKTKLGAGGISGLVLDATFNITDTPASTLQIIQVFWGTRRTDGLVVGKYAFKKGKKTYDGFVDGGINSPFAMAGSPAHPKEPYYLTAAESATQVVFAKDAGSVRVYDRPGAVAYHDEAYFETGIVAVNYKGKGKDKLLKVFKWGWKNLGADPIHGKGIKLGGKPTGISPKGDFGSTAKKIIANDYSNFNFA